MVLYDIGQQPNNNGVTVDFGPGGTFSPMEYIADGAVTPGAVVVPSATDGKAAEAGALALNALGWVLENVAPADPALGTAKDLRTDFADGKRIRVCRNHGSRFMGLILASSAALVHGDKLKTAAGGTLEKFVQGTDNSSGAVATFDELADFTPGGTTTRHIVRWGGGV